MTDVGTFARVSGGRGAGDHRQASRDAGLADYRKSAARLQDTAYRNLRQTIAYATVFGAVLAIWMLLIGQATPVTFPWYAVSILGGAFGLVTYLVREPRARLYVLAVAVILAVVGMTGIFVTS